MGKPAKGVVVTVSSFVAKCEFYMTKMDSYIKDCQALLTHGSKVTESLQTLPSMVLSMDACNTLATLMSCLPQYKEVLRPALVARLERQVLGKVHDFGKQASEDLPVGLHDAVLAVVADACILWPLETSLVELKEEAGIAKGKASIKAGFTQILQQSDFIDGFIKSGDYVAEPLWDAFKKIGDLEIHGPLQPEVLTEDVKPKLVEAEANVVLCFFTNMHKGRTISDDEMSNITKTIQNLATSRGDSFHEVVQIMGLALDVQVNGHELVASPCLAGDGSAEEMAFAVKTSVLKLEGAMKNSKSPFIQKVNSIITDIINKQNLAVTGVSNKLLEQAQKDFGTALESCQPVLKAGAEFFDSKKMPLDKLLKLAETSILQVDPQKCTSDLQSLDKVFRGAPFETRYPSIVALTLHQK
eukprot:6482116-Amphidinium_carterae.3